MTTIATDPVRNEPISYDDHGDIPFEVSFRDIPVHEISIYLQLDTRVGRSTCRQACAHCFYINQPAARNRVMDLAEGRKVMAALERRGYKIFPMIADSFAHGGAFLRLFGNSHNRDFHQELDSKPTKTMVRGDMWTSGAPLLGDDWRELLMTGIENGFGNVTITYHGTLDDRLRVRPHATYPIRGVFPGADCETVIRRIHQFNADMVAGGFERLKALPAEMRSPLAINIGVTLGKHNHTLQHLLRYVRYFNDLGVAVLRFNNFHDHGWKLPLLPLTADEVAQCFRDIRWIHENVPLSFQLGLDEDFGTNGIEVMGFPPHTGWCRAGRQLFAVVPEEPVPLSAGREKIGTIAGCVDAFKPIVGQLVRISDGLSVDYDLQFDHGVIDRLNRKRLDGTYRDGCFAPEMLDEARRGAPEAFS